MVPFSVAYAPGVRVVQMAVNGNPLPPGEFGKICTIKDRGTMEIEVRRCVITGSGEAIPRFDEANPEPVAVPALFFHEQDEPERLQDYKPVAEVFPNSL